MRTHFFLLALGGAVAAPESVFSDLHPNGTSALEAEEHEVVNSAADIGEMQGWVSGFHEWMTETQGTSMKNSPVVGMTKSSRRQESFNAPAIQQHVDNGATGD